MAHQLPWLDGSVGIAGSRAEVVDRDELIASDNSDLAAIRAQAGPEGQIRQLGDGAAIGQL